MQYHTHTHTHTPVIRHHSNQQKQCKKTTLIVSKTIVTQLENGFLATTTSPKTGVCPPMLDSQGCPSLHPGVLIGQVNGVKKIHEILGKQLCCLELRSRKGREKWVYWRSLFGKSGATTIFQSKKQHRHFCGQKFNLKNQKNLLLKRSCLHLGLPVQFWIDAPRPSPTFPKNSRKDSVLPAAMPKEKLLLGSNKNYRKCWMKQVETCIRHVFFLWKTGRFCAFLLVRLS